MNVSIAMASYNGENYLREQLNSILKQTRMPDELIISDDNSEDHTLKIIKEFKKKAPFEVIVQANENNIGYTKNFERALSVTTGDLIFLSDQDDVWFENKIEETVKVYEMEKPLLIICNRLHVDKQLKPLHDNSITRLERLGLDLNSYASGCAMAISRTLKEIALPIPDLEGITYDTWLGRLSLLLESKKLIKKELQYYRCYDSSTSSHVLGRKYKISRAQYIVEKLLITFKKLDRDKTYYLNQINISLQYRDRIEHMRSFITSENILDLKGLDEIKCVLDEQVGRLKTRCNLRKKSLLRKITQVYKHYKEGLYDNYGGLMTAVKDVLTS